ncbi:MAG: Sua5/YciO/YrdC/YwlC family protein, partial [Elusimicrobiales bacterium]|nr:Sua5/YciO/YrdC/YwlC family protein [Elusimicrobiales bacterium]
RKRRPHKPFAVMVADLNAAETHAEIGSGERELLDSPAAPIVLLSWRRDSAVAREVGPTSRGGRLATLGVMLPYTPLHHILLRDVGRPLVMTSGNLSEEPIARENDEALRRLAGADHAVSVRASLAVMQAARARAFLEQAAAVLDGAAGIYGNWTLNARAAALRGAAAWYTRFNTFAEAEALLRRGLPLAVSLTFGPGELRGSPLKKGTRGHFVLLKGFDSRGNIICNEPAVKTGRAERTYRRGEFARAWFRNKYGAAYVIVRDPAVFAAVAVPVGTLYSAPAPTPARKKKTIESQLLMNEAVRPLSYARGWTGIEALEQPHKSGRHRGPGGCYAGFIRADSLRTDPMPPPNYCVRAKSAPAVCAGETIRLSAGTRFYAAPAGKGKLRAWLAGGRLALVGKADCLPFPPPDPGDAPLRRGILAAARQFVGDKYLWGGRSCHGPDCSGLVGVACRVRGLDLPRNADDQWRLSPPARWRDLRPGDLVFSSRPGKPRDIDHVMFYSGGGRLLEATGESGDVRELPFREKFGALPAPSARKTVSGGKTVYFGRLTGNRSRRD